jgi:hypothetical protein
MLTAIQNPVPEGPLMDMLVRLSAVISVTEDHIQTLDMRTSPIRLQGPMPAMEPYPDRKYSPAVGTLYAQIERLDRANQMLNNTMLQLEI